MTKIRSTIPHLVLAPAEPSKLQSRAALMLHQNGVAVRFKHRHLLSPWISGSWLCHPSSKEIFPTVHPKLPKHQGLSHEFSFLIKSYQDIWIRTSHASWIFGVIPQAKLSQVLQCMCTYMLHECLIFEGLVKRVRWNGLANPDSAPGVRECWCSFDRVALHFLPYIGLSQ